MAATSANHSDHETGEEHSGIGSRLVDGFSDFIGWFYKLPNDIDREPLQRGRIVIMNNGAVEHDNSDRDQKE